MMMSAEQQLYYHQMYYSHSYYQGKSDNYLNYPHHLHQSPNKAPSPTGSGFKGTSSASSNGNNYYPAANSFTAPPTHHAT